MPDREFYPKPTRYLGATIEAGMVIADVFVVHEDSSAPRITSGSIYNVAGTLYWNGAPLSGGGGEWSLENGTGPDIYYSAGNVAIGKSAANYPLDVSGVIKTDDNIIVANTKQIQLQDTLGGVTAYLTRDASDNVVLANSTASGDIQITTNSGNIDLSGVLRLTEAGGSDLAAISVAALATSRTYTIPDAGGAANFILSTTASPSQGDILYHNGSSWISLAAGLDGYYLKTQGAGANPVWSQEARNNLTEATSSVLTITGGTNAVLGSGTTIQVKVANSGQSGYLLNTDWSDFDAKYDGLPSQTGNAGRYLTTDGTEPGGESWATIVSSAVAGYTAIGFDTQTSVTVTHNFGAYPIVQVLDEYGVQIIPSNISHTNTNEFVVTFTTATTGSIIASVGSPYVWNIVGKTADYTLQSSDTVVLANAAITLTLPTAVGVEGKVYTIKNITSEHNVTVAGDGVELVDTDNEFTLPPRSSISVVSDSTQWWVV